jgi:membrane-associated PAP2 superfamily phosphatase
VVLVGLTIPFWMTDLDVSIARRFYETGAGWARGGQFPWNALFHYGVIPAWVLAVSALAVLVASFWAARCRPHRRAAIFLVLAMMVGPGLVVNNVFKQHWGRPRPRDLVVFGGDRDYVKPWVKSPRGNGNAFVSGHAATGFYLLVPYFLLRRRSKARAASLVALGVGYGAIIGVARMAQGAHFLSDILWALGFVYLSGLALFYALRLDQSEPLTRES